MRINLIGFCYRRIAKPIFFKFDPEFIHDSISFLGQTAGNWRFTRLITRVLLRYQNKALEVNIAGLHFSNPVGLSAGFDKNAKLLKIIPEVGFGFEEVGSITYGAYEGNQKPRLVRLPKSKALIVYYGLMNEGVRSIVARIKKIGKLNMITGISVAKTNCLETAGDEAGARDYIDCLKILESEQIGDYYTLNISCPNTFGGEPFTTPERLEMLLGGVVKLKIAKPVFVKMPINLPIEEFDALLAVIAKYKLTGVIIGNLTKVRDPKLIKDEVAYQAKGGISGYPTQQLSNELITHTYKLYGNKLVIIGVGGIFSAADAYEKIKRGASLLQLITGMIFQGPQLIGEINRGLADLLKKDGFTDISQAVGTAN